MSATAQVGVADGGPVRVVGGDLSDHGPCLIWMLDSQFQRS
jgi:hypothetical protein